MKADPLAEAWSSQERMGITVRNGHAGKIYSRTYSYNATENSVKRCRKNCSATQY
jgi:hypothetical protein